MKMNERPLVIDISSHQGIFNYSQIDTEIFVHGVISRAGLGFIKDEQFDRNWAKSKQFGKARQGYWAIAPAYNIPTQIDKWFEVQPVIDCLPRVLDAELKGTSAQDTAYDIVTVSNAIFERDGERPWLYFGRYFAKDNIIPFVEQAWLDEHYIILAQYDLGDGKEYDSVILPDGIDINKVIFKQTTDKLPLFPGSGPVDRDRFLLGGVEELDDFYAMHGYGIPVNGVPCDCDERLLEQALTNEDLYGRIDQLESGFRAHSTRQGLRKVDVDGQLVNLSDRSHVHRSWRERFFRGAR